MTQNYVTQRPEWKWLANHPCNVVLRHHGNKFCKHEAGIGGDEIFRKCAKQIADFEGPENVIAYLKAMEYYYPTSAGRTLKRFMAL